MDYRDIRTRSSIHLEVNGISLIVDTGPDFRQQVLRESIKKLDAIIYTHEHKDHTGGLDDVRSFNFKQKIDMPVFAEKNVLAQFGNICFPYSIQYHGDLQNTMLVVL